GSLVAKAVIREQRVLFFYRRENHRYGDGSAQRLGHRPAPEDVRFAGEQIRGNCAKRDPQPVKVEASVQDFLRGGVVIQQLGQFLAAPEPRGDFDVKPSEPQLSAVTKVLALDEGGKT